MRRLIPVLLPFVVLAACTDGGGAPPLPTATADLRVGFPTGGLADTITVSAVDRLPLRGAALVAPDGAAIPADWIQVNADPRVATGQWVAGNPWETSLTGSSAAAALTTPNVEVNAALRSQVQLPRLGELPRAAHFRHAARRDRGKGSRRSRAAAASRGTARPGAAAGVTGETRLAARPLFRRRRYLGRWFNRLKLFVLWRNNSAENSGGNSERTANYQRQFCNNIPEKGRPADRRACPLDAEN